MATCGVCGVRVSGESEDGLCPRCRRAGLDGSGAGRAGTGTRVAGFERPVAPPASVEEEPFDRRDLRRTIMARARARRSLETQKPGFDGDTSTPSPLGTAPLALPPAGPDLADTAPFVPRDASGTGTAPLGLVTAADKTPDAPRAVDPLGTAPLGLTPDGRARDGGSPNVGRPAPSPFDTAPLGNGHGPAASPVGSAGDAKGTRRLGGMNDGPIVGTNGGSGVGPARTSESPNDSDLPTRLIVPLHDPRSDEADFVLQRKLGEGAMGIVWEALERLTGRRVALKRIKPEFAAELQSQFFYEARITATLEHPNIAPIYDLGFDQDRVPFYAQKKIVGRTWTELLDDLFDQPEPRRLIEPHLDHFERVLDAIGLAHDRGVLHRDIKPDNVMIGEFGEIYVTDWGLAIRPRDLPGVGDPRLSAGSPAYMSPEVAGGSEARVGFPSDVYLLGALLFELATGRAPHEPVADDLSPEQAMREAFRLARENRFGIEIDPTDELQAIAVRVMATRPEQRPSIGEIREDLKEYRGRVQSRRLSDTAAAEFERAIETGDLGRFQKSFYGFETALDLWSENPDAIVGLRRTRLEWARTLAAKHNYNQALAVLDTQVPEQRQLATLYARRASRQRFQRLTIVGLWAVLVLGSIGAIGAGAMALQQIASAKNELAGIEKQAVVSQEKAETETRKAEEATRLASEKQALAAAETERARIATEAATEATTALEKARDEIRTVNADLNAKQAELTRKETELQAKQTELEEKNEKLAQATRDVQAAQAQQEAADRAATAARQAERLARSAQRPLMRELATEGYRGLIEAALTDASIDAVESAMEMLGRAEAQLNSLDPVYRDDDSAGGIDALSPHWESRYLSRRLWPGATIDLSGPIVSTALGDDGTMLVAGDRRLTVWRPNGDSFQAIAEVEVPGGGEIGPMLIAPDSRVAWIGTAGGNGTAPGLFRLSLEDPRSGLVRETGWSADADGLVHRSVRSIDIAGSLLCVAGSGRRNGPGVCLFPIGSDGKLGPPLPLLREMSTETEAFALFNLARLSPDGRRAIALGTTKPNPDGKTWVYLIDVDQASGAYRAVRSELSGLDELRRPVDLTARRIDADGYELMFVAKHAVGESETLKVHRIANGLPPLEIGTLAGARRIVYDRQGARQLRIQDRRLELAYATDEADREEADSAMTVRFGRSIDLAELSGGDADRLAAAVSIGGRIGDPESERIVYPEVTESGSWRLIVRRPGSGERSLLADLGSPVESEVPVVVAARDVPGSSGVVALGDTSGRLRFARDGRPQEVADWPSDPDDDFRTLAVGDRLVSVSIGGDVRILDAVRSEFVWRRWKPIGDDGVRREDAALSPDGSILCVLGSDRRIYRLRLDGSETIGRAITEPQETDGQVPPRIVFDPTGRQLVGISEGARFFSVDVADGRATRVQLPILQGDGIVPLSAVGRCRDGVLAIRLREGSTGNSLQGVWWNTADPSRSAKLLIDLPLPVATVRVGCAIADDSLGTFVCYVEEADKGLSIGLFRLPATPATDRQESLVPLKMWRAPRADLSAIGLSGSGTELVGVDGEGVRRWSVDSTQLGEAIPSSIDRIGLDPTRPAMILGDRIVLQSPKRLAIVRIDGSNAIVEADERFGTPLRKIRFARTGDGSLRGVMLDEAGRMTIAEWMTDGDSWRTIGGRVVPESQSDFLLEGSSGAITSISSDGTRGRSFDPLRVREGTETAIDRLSSFVTLTGVDGREVDAASDFGSIDGRWVRADGSAVSLLPVDRRIVSLRAVDRGGHRLMLIESQREGAGPDEGAERAFHLTWLDASGAPVPWRRNDDGDGGAPLAAPLALDELGAQASSAMLTPDGTRLLVGSRDGKLTVYLLDAPWKPHVDAAEEVAAADQVPLTVSEPLRVMAIDFRNPIGDLRCGTLDDGARIWFSLREVDPLRQRQVSRAGVLDGRP